MGNSERVKASPDEATNDSSWRTFFLSVVLIGLGIAAGFERTHLKFEWTSIVLILIGIAIRKIPVRNIGGLIESFEFGKAKILFRQTQDLERSVEQAVLEGAAKLGGEPEIKTSSASENATEDSEKAPQLAGSEIYVDESKVPRTNVNRLVLDLMTQDREAALIKLSITIEAELAKLAKKHDVKIPRTGLIWNRVIEELLARNVITAEVGHSLLKFRNVRNSIIHSSSENPPSGTAVISAIDSGLKLLNLLTAEPT